MTIDKLLQKVIAPVLATGLVYGTANAAPIFDIQENDNLPSYSNVGDLTEATWDISAENSSGFSASEVNLYDVFSLNTPTPGNLPSAWNFNATPGSGANLYNINFNTGFSPAEITSGSSKDFQFLTYRDNALSDIQVGTLYGQGGTAVGLVPVNPGDDFQGPVGIVPEPTSLVLGVGLAGLLSLRRNRDQVKTEYKR